MKKHLEPLARASCIMQAAHARLDDVPLIFGTLTKEYRDLQVTDGNDEGVIDAMLKSIEKRWKSTTDQEIFILTIILHPALKLAPFSAAASLSRASIWYLVHACASSMSQHQSSLVTRASFMSYVNILMGRGNTQHLAHGSRGLLQRQKGR